MWYKASKLSHMSEEVGLNIKLLVARIAFKFFQAKIKGSWFPLRIFYDNFGIFAGIRPGGEDGAREV